MSLKHKYEEMITEPVTEPITAADVRIALEYNVIPHWNVPYESEELLKLVERYHKAYDEMQEVKKQVNKLCTKRRK